MTVITLWVSASNFAGGLVHLASVSYKSDGKPRVRGVFRYLRVIANTPLTNFLTAADRPYSLI